MLTHRFWGAEWLTQPVDFQRVARLPNPTSTSKIITDIQLHKVHKDKEQYLDTISRCKVPNYAIAMTRTAVLQLHPLWPSFILCAENTAAFHADQPQSMVMVLPHRWFLNLQPAALCTCSSFQSKTVICALILLPKGTEASVFSRRRKPKMESPK
jgi:hypothetical protein